MNEDTHITKYSKILKKFKRNLLQWVNNKTTLVKRRVTHLATCQFDTLAHSCKDIFTATPLFFLHGFIQWI